MPVRMYVGSVSTWPTTSVRDGEREVGQAEQQQHRVEVQPAEHLDVVEDDPDLADSVSPRAASWPGRATNASGRRAGRGCATPSTRAVRLAVQPRSATLDHQLAVARARAGGRAGTATATQQTARRPWRPQPSRAAARDSTSIGTCRIDGNGVACGQRAHPAGEQRDGHVQAGQEVADDHVEGAARRGCPAARSRAR